jgi:hypothetical protein
MSKSGNGHLAPGVREHLQLGDDARIVSMQRDRWIGYARAGAVLERLGRLLATPSATACPVLSCMALRTSARRRSFASSFVIIRRPSMKCGAWSTTR